jgi:hypothetical protein
MKEESYQDYLSLVTKGITEMPNKHSPKKNTSAAIINILVAFVIIFPSAMAQNLLRAPESAVYDSVHHRYLASNYGTGHIVAIDSLGNQSYFVQNQYCKNGLHIESGIIYAACIDQGVRGFDLNTTDLVAQINIDGMINLNDITSDSSGNLYVSDVYASRINRIRISDYSYTTFVDCDAIEPNGLYFDAVHNRLLMAAYTSPASIWQIGLDDSSMTEIVNTGYNYLDGLTQDNEGNYYFSAWQTYAIYRYDSLFSQEAEFIYRNTNGPADIFFNKVLNELAIPVMNSNAIVFMQIPSSIDETGPSIPNSDQISSYCYPNPFNSSASIHFNLPKSSDVVLEIYNILGQKNMSISLFNCAEGDNYYSWRGGDYKSGMYIYRLSAGQNSSFGKMLLLK